MFRVPIVAPSDHITDEDGSSGSKGLVPSIPPWESAGQLECESRFFFLPPQLLLSSE